MVEPTKSAKMIETLRRSSGTTSGLSFSGCPQARQNRACAGLSSPHAPHPRMRITIRRRPVHVLLDGHALANAAGHGDPHRHVTAVEAHPWAGSPATRCQQADSAGVGEVTDSHLAVGHA